MRTVLAERLAGIGPASVALSGGVDSMTLAVMAGRSLGHEAIMVHAVSPAVPPEATERVIALAGQEDWRLERIDAGEFQDENYRSNPVNRCFFCKGNLYGAIAGLRHGTILSGTNLDDLGEYRPGLEAAKQHGVRHPFVEVGLDKAAVRALARELGLGTIAELPASPCLSSRVETSIRIEPDWLRAIHAAETLVGDALGPKTVRCRLRRGAIVIELDPASLDRADASLRASLAEAVAGRLPASLAGARIDFAPYRNGSAFIGAPAPAP